MLGLEIDDEQGRGEHGMSRSCRPALPARWVPRSRLRRWLVRFLSTDPLVGARAGPLCGGTAVSKKACLLLVGPEAPGDLGIPIADRHELRRLS